MHCPACGHQNRADARYCGACGAGLFVDCAACGAANPASNRFCNGCGQALAGTREPAPRSYTPPHLAEKILVSRSAVEGERKQVTVLFCDLANSTELARRIGAEAMHERLNRFFAVALAEVHAVEGTVNQFLGDGFMALFGAPVAHEDHLRRGLLAALAILQRMREAAAAGDPMLGTLRVRMGLNTGPVVVGGIGDNLRMDYTAVGDTTNLAARLQSVARPGTACVGESVAVAAAPWFEFDAREPVTLKGIEQPVHVHELLRARSTPLADRGRGLGIGAALVGRDAELQRLGEAVQSLAAGQGSVLLLVGEPGVGKSRLVAEARRLPAAAAVAWFEGRALSYGRHLSYRPFIDVLRGVFEIGPDDADAAALRKLEAGLRDLFGERAAELLPYLSTVLALPVPEALQERVRYLDGPALKRQVFLCLRQLFERLAQRRPLVLLLEDWHWADASSAELADHLLPLTTAVPLLVLFPTRPDPATAVERARRFAAGEPGARLAEVQLEPLPLDASGQLVDRLLGRMALPGGLRERIVQRADGNPFFIEEIVRGLVSEGVLSRSAEDGAWRLAVDGAQVQLPDSLQALLLARIDRLDEDAKQALKLASVIGRSFFDRVLSTIAARADRLAQQLAVLEQSDLVRDKQREPEPEHIFKHALVQEAAYASLLAEQRREVHRRVARAIESLFADRLDEFTSLLAHHYTCGEDWEAAQAYLFKAGDQAGRMAADTEALEHFRLAEAAYQRAYGDRLTPLQRASLSRKVGIALYGTGQYEPAHERLRQALHELGVAYPGPGGGVRGAILRLLGRHLWRRLLARLGRPAPRTVDPASAAEVSTVAHAMAWMDYFLDKERMLLDSLVELHIGESSTHALAEARGLSSLGFGFMTFGAMGWSRRYHEAAARAAERSGDPTAVAFAAFASGWLDFYCARWDDSLERIGFAVRHWRETGDIHRWAGGMTMLLLMLQARGELARAQTLAAEQLRAGEDTGDPQVASWGLQNLAFPALALGQYVPTEGQLRRGQQMAARIPSWDNLIFQKGLLVKCLTRQQRFDEAEAELADAHAIVKRERLRLAFDRAELYTADAELANALAERAAGPARRAALRRAVASGRRAVGCARRMPLWLPQSLRLLGRAQWLAGQRPAALRTWREAADTAERFGFVLERAATLYEQGRCTGDASLADGAGQALRAAGAQGLLGAGAAA